MQDDRDLRDERRRQKLEPAYQFLIRLRLPGGVCTPEQWLKIDELARAYGNETLRLTTRQTFQFHWVLKHNLKATIQGLHEALIDTIAACGDVLRGVMCSVNPRLSALHAEVYDAGPARRAITPFPICAPITRSGMVRSGSRPPNRRSRSIGEPICRASSRSASSFRRSTTSTSITQDLGFIAIVGDRQTRRLRYRDRRRHGPHRSGARDLSAARRCDRLRAGPTDCSRSPTR